MNNYGAVNNDATKRKAYEKDIDGATVFKVASVMILKYREQRLTYG